MSADGWTKPLQKLIDLGKAYDAGYPLPPLTLDIPAPYVLLPLKPLIKSKPFSLSPDDWEALVAKVAEHRRSMGLLLAQQCKLLGSLPLESGIRLIISVPKGLLAAALSSTPYLEQAFQDTYGEPAEIRFLPR